MRKVYVELKVRLVIRADEGVNISKVVDEMDYDFQSTMDEADIEDSEILDMEITDSK